MTDTQQNHKCPKPQTKVQIQSKKNQEKQNIKIPRKHGVRNEGDTIDWQPRRGKCTRVTRRDGEQVRRLNTGEGNGKNGPKNNGQKNRQRGKYNHQNNPGKEEKRKQETFKIRESCKFRPKISRFTHRNVVSATLEKVIFKRLQASDIIEQLTQRWDGVAVRSELLEPTGH